MNVLGYMSVCMCVWRWKNYVTAVIHDGW